jgi:hypothetical protein
MSLWPNGSALRVLPLWKIGRRLKGTMKGRANQQSLRQRTFKPPRMTFELELNDD